MRQRYTRTDAKKTLFVAMSRAVASADAMRPFIADHLRYMNA